MTGRSTPQTLQALAKEQTCRLTIRITQNFLVQERKDEVYHRKVTRESQRKRSYSCGDEIEANSRASKKLKAESVRLESITTEAGKRQRGEDDEGEDFVHIKKRQKIGETSHGCVSPSASNSFHGNQGGQSRDDASVPYRGPSREKFEVLKHYFLSLSPLVWTDYGSSLVNAAVETVRREDTDVKFLGKIIEHVLCAKLLFFSTQAIENYSSELEEIFFDKLKTCRRLVDLDVTIVPRSERDIVAASLSLQTMAYLHSLFLLPSSRFSYHWAISHVSHHCLALRDFKVVYNGDLFENTSELTNLEKCHKLTSLWLFNIGRKSETRAVSQLLESLKNLKALFHKELPNAILELLGERGSSEHAGDSRAGRRYLGLERVDLCWYQRAVGYQLVYVPSSYLLQVAQACPQIRILNLVGPPCLAQVLENLSHLQTLILQQTSLTSCLACTLNNFGLSKITELRVSDVWDVTHDIISAVACGCPNLQVLNIINSSLEAQGDLQIPTHRQPFPHLRQATLVPVMIHSRPSLTTPSVWQLGADLTSYLLRGTSKLTTLHLQYKPEDILNGDLPSAQCLEAALTWHRPALNSLLLEWPPAVSPGLVRGLLRACPALTSLASITTWPLSANQRAAIVTQYGRLVDIK